MPLEVSTKDCAQLSEAELAHIATLCSESPSSYALERLTEEATKWVLVTQVHKGALPAGIFVRNLGAHRGNSGGDLGCGRSEAQRQT